MTTMTADLTAMIDSLDTGWTEEVEWAEILAVHTAACTATMVSLTVGQLRHFECRCERRVELRKELRTRIPLLTQLAESKWIVQVGSNSDEGGKVKRLHPPIPGGLEAADEVIREIEWAVETVCRDWSLKSVPLIQAQLADIRFEIGARLATERDDAAAVLRPAWQAARRHLGYDRRPLRLFCDCGARMRLEGQELACEGCGRRQEIHADLAVAMIMEATRRQCRRRHDPNWRINAQGNQVCQTCTDLLASRRVAKKAKDDMRRIGQRGEAVVSS